ncbi:ribosyldihydronicotinamide dehydrogenase [quinone] isoform X2 [Pelobates cultripes]|uniref:Ribosyldihydronicotinamide dehydrogenase [quinone] isoform X2 n=1 Tax=Pelobates cultripes TaxID=61616 RepID=A0AAD1W2J0_PELCU|nr:ribosyldihydronicotinamide dehydrogenase [quinone] isoform X2 [Pelobates cultripes]
MPGKNVLIVYAHQEPKSMNGSLKNIAVDVLQKQGCSIIISDLYSMNFNAAATRNDITGELCNPQHFRYGAETMEAFKKGVLCEDILKEQEKVKVADLIIFQDKLALLSFTTGGTEEMFSKDGMRGDIRYLLWPMQHGIMHFCGFKVLAPQITYAPEYVGDEKRKNMLLLWARRLEAIWDERPIECTPPWYFQ